MSASSRQEPLAGQSRVRPGARVAAARTLRAGDVPISRGEEGRVVAAQHGKPRRPGGLLVREPARPLRVLVRWGPGTEGWHDAADLLYL